MISKTPDNALKCLITCLNDLLLVFVRFAPFYLRGSRSIASFSHRPHDLTQRCVLPFPLGKLPQIISFSDSAIGRFV